ncbi:hypothetical protein [Reichenbachiella sp.]
MKLITRMVLILIVLSSTSCALEEDEIQPSSLKKKTEERDLLELIGAGEE